MTTTVFEQVSLDLEQRLQPVLETTKNTVDQLTASFSELRTTWADQAPVLKLQTHVHALATKSEAATRQFTALAGSIGLWSRASNTTADHMVQAGAKTGTLVQKAGLVSRAWSRVQSGIRAVKADLSDLEGAHARVDAKLRELRRRRDELHQAKPPKLDGSAYEIAKTNFDGAVGQAKSLYGAMSRLASPAIQFEQAMLGVSQAVAGARDKNGNVTDVYHQLGTKIQELSTQIPNASGEIAKLVQTSAGTGLTDNIKDTNAAVVRLVDHARLALDLSGSLSELSAETAATSMASLADSFKLSSEQARDFGDQLNFLAGSAHISGGDVMSVLEGVADTAAKVGMSIKDTAGLGATFIELGVDKGTATKATNAMLGTLGEASTQSPRAQNLMRDLGLSAEGIEKGMAADASGSLRKVLGEIAKLGAASRQEYAAGIFGNEHAATIVKLAKASEVYAQNLRRAHDASAKGSLAKDSGVRNNATYAVIQKAQNAIQETATSLGQLVTPDVSKIAEAIGDIAKAVTEWVRENPNLARTILRVTTALAAYRVAVSALKLAGIAGTPKMKAMTQAFKNQKLAVAELTTNMRKNLVTSAAWSEGKLANADKAIHRGKRRFKIRSVKAGRALRALPGKGLSMLRAAPGRVTEQIMFGQIRYQAAKIKAGKLRDNVWQKTGGRVMGMAKDPGRQLHLGRRRFKIGIAKAGRGVGKGLGKLVAGSKALTAAFKTLFRVGIITVLTGLRALSMAVIANPIGVLVAAVAAAGYVIYRNWDTISAYLGGVWNGFIEGIRPMLDEIMPHLQAGWEQLSEIFAEVSSWVGSLFGQTEATTEGLNRAGEAGRSFGEQLAAGVMFAYEKVKAFIGTAKSFLVWTGLMEEEEEEEEEEEVQVRESTSKDGPPAQKKPRKPKKLVRPPMSVRTEAPQQAWWSVAGDQAQKFDLHPGTDAPGVAMFPPSTIRHRRRSGAPQGLPGAHHTQNIHNDNHWTIHVQGCDPEAVKRTIRSEIDRLERENRRHASLSFAGS